jgi:hypothetical protein
MFRYSQNQQMSVKMSCRFVTLNVTHYRIIHLEMRAEVRVRSSLKYGFHCISFPTIHKHLIKLFGHICFENFPNCIESVPEKILLPFKIKYGFHCTNFYNSNFCSTGICEDFRYGISLISAKKCEMPLSIRLGAAVYHDDTKPIFKKLFHTRQLFVKFS